MQVNLSHRAGEVELDVIDNGGSPAAATQGGRGLSNMRTRAARLGGRLQVEFGRPGARVVLAVPLRAT